MMYECGFTRYVQGKDAISQLRSDLIGLDRICIVGGKRALDAFLPFFPEENGTFRHLMELPESPTNWSSARDLAESVIAENDRVVLGVGGGSAMDTAKAIAEQSGRPVFLVPTSGATCACATRLIALYDKEGKRSGASRLSRPIQGIYADEELLASSPIRLLAAGIADGMAKLSETASACLYADNPPEMQWRTSMAQTLHLMDIYFTHAESALSGDRAAQSEILYANFFLTSQITATGSIRRTGEIAHAFYNGITRLFPSERNRFLHGEIVGVGVLLEMELTGTVAGYSRRTIKNFLSLVLHCPTRLSDLSLPTDEVTLARLSAFISEKAGLNPRTVVTALGTVC